MDFFSVTAMLITLAAFFSYLNHRFVRLPATIGIMLIALLASLLLLLLHRFGIDFDDRARYVLASVDFNEALMEGMLAFLLFAGALHVDLGNLREQAGVVAWLATVGVALSTLLIGLLTWCLLPLIGLSLPLLHCFLFGALISPTDPVAVLGILKSVGVSKSLEAKIVGESLFNDGIGVVVFLVLLDFANGGRDPSAGEVAQLLGREALGGALLGFGGGFVAYRMLRSVDDYKVEILGTLSLVMGVYALASTWHLSGPIAVVVAGLMIGNHGRSFAMSEHTREHLDTFWELVDEILNAVLFVLIGLEVLVVSFTTSTALAAAVAVLIVLLVRFVGVAVPVAYLRRYRTFSPNVVAILTWAGVRGGISVALALSLPSGPHRELIVAITYGVVLFSILVQGLSLGWFIRRTSEVT